MDRLKTFIRPFVTALCVLGSMTWAQDASAAIKVASWNIQIFGPSKAKNMSVMKIIVGTLKQYDLVLVQEIRDTTDIARMTLLAHLNAVTGNAYSMIVSNRLGRTNATEQYAFIYKKSALKVVDSYHHASPDNLFERAPFIVRFSTTQAKVNDFFVVSSHTDRASVNVEIGSLVKVYDDAVKRWGVIDSVLMGNWNAGCNYLPKKAWATNPLRKDPRFTWLIGDGTDTTVGKTICAYDRAVVAGSKMTANATQGRAVYRYTQPELDTESMRMVSDHYPIEFVIN
ncbi:MAG: hypothetical protein EOO71_07410 [Myxococcaceae bacterium]|nr:MAG: hypothetical protein EOO71_07410 [Myxococcaceae bacterium]